MFVVNTVLHPTDLNDDSKDVYRAACDVARQNGARLIALHIAPDGIVSYMDKVSERPTEETKEKLWEAVRRPRDEEKGIEVEHRIEDGEPLGEILRVARETNSDMIVMGTHGRSGIARWFTNSVAEEVVRKAPCSVLIVKPPHLADPDEQASTSEYRVQHENDVSAGESPPGV